MEHNQELHNKEKKNSIDATVKHKALLLKKEEQ